jgi:hypothetical protein
LPRQLFQDHGIHNAYDENMCTLYDLNCMYAYNRPLARRYKSHTGTWEPEQSFISNHGPGRNELVKKKRQSWVDDNQENVQKTEYQCRYALN